MRLFCLSSPVPFSATPEFGALAAFFLFAVAIPEFVPSGRADTDPLDGLLFIMEVAVPELEPTSLSLISTNKLCKSVFWFYALDSIAVPPSLVIVGLKPLADLEKGLFQERLPAAFEEAGCAMAASGAISMSSSAASLSGSSTHSQTSSFLAGFQPGRL
ncbi:hypothetical protein HPB48_002776 [Haemaphysalis longicornis]|uniref:Uncharacterized protein n=1 Tax=Haemaphysalis longicornis TaxID=44386 RepID=A0A9J6GMU5_HAELO|nr:hypothetical protein HPB48_002776 [Haemaphysalis longicornis]